MNRVISFILKISNMTENMSLWGFYEPKRKNTN